MSEEPSPCPACGSYVALDAVLDGDACPECGTGLSDLFDLARHPGAARGGETGGDHHA